MFFKRTFLLAILFILFFAGTVLSDGEIGELIMVDWEEGWYFARILEDTGGSIFVTYPFYDSSLDEWIPPERFLEE